MLGHTDMLLDDGRVREVEHGDGEAPTVRFESLVEPPPADDR